MVPSDHVGRGFSLALEDARFQVQELTRLVESTLFLAVQAEQAGRHTTAAFHLDRAMFLEQELRHQQAIAAAA